MNAPAPFVARMNAREACPDSVKETLGEMSAGELCFAVVLAVTVCIAATWAANLILERLNSREGPCL